MKILILANWRIWKSIEASLATGKWQKKRIRNLIGGEPTKTVALQSKVLDQKGYERCYYLLLEKKIYLRSSLSLFLLEELNNKYISIIVKP